MNYQTWILEKLIGKYERRNSVSGGSFLQKIAFRMQDEQELSRSLEIAEEKEQFLSALSGMKQRGLIDFSWVRYERENLVERVWLVTEDGKIKECYKILKRTPKEDIVDTLKRSLSVCVENMKHKDNEVLFFLEKLLKSLEQKVSIPRFFTEDKNLNENILKCLNYLIQNDQEIQERVLSGFLYGDSKYFERHVKGKVLSILKAIKKEKGEEFPDEELLPEHGVVKWPEILEFKGNLLVQLKNGSRIDFSFQIYGAYINSLTVENVEEITTNGIKRVIFIENKANYISYIAKHNKSEELVIFHGGCYSPVKGRWFKKIHEACSRHKERVEFYHWSDIDVGGFRIFERLKTQIIPGLEPYHMNIETLEKYYTKGMPIKESYRKLLMEMIQDPKYDMFWCLMERMLELNIRLEQEQLLY